MMEVAPAGEEDVLWLILAPLRSSAPAVALPVPISVPVPIGMCRRPVHRSLLW